jgi:hypothetical protein
MDGKKDGDEEVKQNVDDLINELLEGEDDCDSCKI